MFEILLTVLIAAIVSVVVSRIAAHTAFKLDRKTEELQKMLDKLNYASKTLDEKIINSAKILQITNPQSKCQAAGRDE